MNEIKAALGKEGQKIKETLEKIGYEFMTPHVIINASLMVSDCPLWSTRKTKKVAAPHATKYFERKPIKSSVKDHPGSQYSNQRRTGEPLFLTTVTPSVQNAACQPAGSRRPMKSRGVS